MNITNPISVEARGKIYVASIVIAALAIIATAILAVIELQQWLPVVVAIVSSSSFLAGALARDNLAEVDMTEVG